MNDVPELRIADISDRLVEVDMIQNVVEVDPDNELFSFSPAWDARALQDAQISGEKTRTTKLISSLGSEAGTGGRKVRDGQAGIVGIVAARL